MGKKEKKGELYIPHGTPMKNQDVAKIFYEIADLLEIQGVSPFRYRAYRQAAQTIEALGEDIEIYHQEKKLQSLPGIGEALAKKIGILLFAV